MKKTLAFLVGVFIFITTANAQVIENTLLGSVNKEVGNGDFVEIYNNIYHTTQYMPGFPTAATIWPRVIEIDCNQFKNYMGCKSYFYSQSFGRAEYLFFSPKEKPVEKPTQVIERIIETVKPIIVYKEVPVKRIPQ